MKSYYNYEIKKKYKYGIGMDAKVSENISNGIILQMESIGRKIEKLGKMVRKWNEGAQNTRVIYWIRFCFK